MAQRQLRTLVEDGAFFESPRWHDGRWWISDFFRHRVITVDSDGRKQEMLTVKGQPSGLGWLPDGSLLVVSMLDRRILHWTPAAGTSVHADVSAQCGGPLNDMVVDRYGRAYVGNFGFDLYGGADPRPAGLLRVDPDGTVVVAAEDLLFPNGSVITSDGRTLIVGETAGARLTAFALGADGTLADRRVWAQLAPTPTLSTLPETLAQMRSGPDGCTLDADGFIWAADEVTARCVRVASGGAVVDEIVMPAGLVCFACMLGGDDGRTLLICASPDFDPAARAAAHESVLLTTRVDVPHTGLP